MMCAVLPLIIDARRAALAGLLDHAALFPPASMTMAAALAEDARVRAGADSWLVRRFVVPASRLGELGDAELPLALVLDAPYAGGDPRVEAVEARPGTDPETVAGLAAEIYVELPADLARLAQLGLRAKVRCGGAAIPSVEELGSVVRDCRRLGLVFKATAGLHHAYPTDAGEHGFLNLLAAAVFGEEEEALRERAPAFALDADSFRWRDQEAPPAKLADVRASLFHSIGTCSFFEPVEELEELGIL